MRVHVFTGPTAVGDAAREAIPDCFIHPPARHGDFLRHNLRDGEIAVLIDGLYHGNQPIRHKEIMEVISRGVVVIGAASMGALRAAELHQFGMVGVGKVFESYRDGHIEADDEVAVLHTEGPDWKVLSEALVNMRHQLDGALRAGIVSASQKDALLERAHSLHYPRRSWRSVEQTLGADPTLREAARRMTEFVRAAGDASNLKLLDAQEGLRYAQALATASRPSAPSSSLGADWPSGWRTAYLRKWNCEFTGEVMREHFISKSSHFDYQRLFGTDQIDRWRRYVLSAMAGIPAGSPLEQLEERALVAAAALGLDADSVPEGQAAHWLTKDEQRTLSPRQKIITVLVRSSRLTANLSDGHSDRWLLPDRSNSSELIAASFDINEQVQLTSFSKHIDHLKPSVLQRHLCTLWNIGAANSNAEELNAAARDRGFATAVEAAEALRPFFLKDYNDRRRVGA
ncbi:TfuA-like protein [Streptomyces sp. NPDC056337]|uniref:TfuA-like protein n=1 Tax=Streptomyces sp. NPDC056337 TaxID=3345787 RepID=UPI0035DF0AF7